MSKKKMKAETQVGAMRVGPYGVGSGLGVYFDVNWTITSNGRNVPPGERKRWIKKIKAAERLFGLGPTRKFYSCGKPQVVGHCQYVIDWMPNIKKSGE